MCARPRPGPALGTAGAGERLAGTAREPWARCVYIYIYMERERYIEIDR